MRKYYILLVFLYFGIGILQAQISTHEPPRSFGRADIPALPRAATRSLPSIDIQKHIAEDRASERNFRFAAPIPTDLSLQTAGVWQTFPSGDRLWQLQINVPNALGLAVLYDRFWIPKGATLHVYSADKKQVLGAYTARNNKSSQKFMTGIIYSENIILEYFEPKEVAGQGTIHIHKIMQAYTRQRVLPAPDQPFKVYGGGGFGSSLDCHVNVNCAEGAPVQTEKRSVVRIMVVVEEGMGWCSGTLVNNTAQDGRPYILSAYHCQDGYTPEYDFYRFDFNYETSGCADPAVEPTFQSIVGCTNRAGRRESDFQLLELTTDIPASYQPYYCGWNRSTTYLPNQTWNIHHPNGDIKKIAVDEDAATIYPNAVNWSNDVTTPPNNHLYVFYETGTFEGGSSGSPLLDENGHLLGQLNGGNASCSYFEGFFGRFALSWNVGSTAATRLQDWLDPLGINPLTLDGYEPAATYHISGAVYTATMEAILGATVFLYDQQPDHQTMPIDSIRVDAQGNYLFSDLAAERDYYIRVQKDTAYGNGVSTFDIVLLQQQILGIIDFDSPYKYLAADVNNDGVLTTFDVVQLRQLVLQIISDFPDAASWEFMDPTFVFENPLDPFSSLPQSMLRARNVLQLNANQNHINFVGYKKGDAGADADPTQ